MHELSEDDFNQRVDHVQDLIEHAVDACDLDLDMEQVEGSLILRLGDGSRVVIGRQPASREIWLATPGATLHFGYQPGEGWTCDSDGELLGDVLGGVLGELVGDQVELDIDEQ
ncbi:MAG TPA: iron donor protein CyaY [Pseudomonas xinjiangensis]|uniref:Iron donor protein CyaY n=2 Tax=root TaxID=1 RepID=A0A7V1BPM0_9GAMM|nr:iron donor protein CyaY [Halopseudomonas xinjiangensis]HEC49271.1 iron donor protein CyaY [Halopseudomonas xinjiangensis]